VGQWSRAFMESMGLLPWLVPAGALGLAAFWIWFTTGSVANPLESPESVMTMLLILMNRGVKRGELRIQVRGDPRRQIIFTKYVQAPKVGIRSSFVELPGTEDAFARLAQDLALRSIRHSRDRDRKGRRRLLMDYGRDLGLAHLVVVMAFEGAFNVQIANECVAYFKFVLGSNRPDMTGIDAPNRTGRY